MAFKFNLNVSQYPAVKSKVASSTPNCVSRGDVYLSLGIMTKPHYDMMRLCFAFYIVRKLLKMFHYQVYQR